MTDSSADKPPSDQSLPNVRGVNGDHSAERDTPLSHRANTQLESISTSWAVLRDPHQFVLRYGPAIRGYVESLLRNGHSQDVEEVLQDFLLRVVQRGFFGIDPARGRFRDYLKTCVRNAVVSHLRRKRPVVIAPDQIDALAILAAADSAADTAWVEHWRRCLLEKAWRELDRHQRRSDGNLYYTVLRAAVDHQNEDSESLAGRVSEKAGRTISAEAFRKTLSRARRVFAQALLAEVADTLDCTAPESVEQELIDVGLWEYVRTLLPEDWPTLL